MLEVRNLSKRFDEVIALDDCSFSVRPGRLTGFLGPNGAGKTTAMRAIFGLVLLEEGEIRWNGAPLQRSDRRGFGYMPEERGLYPKMLLHEQVAHFGFVAGMNRADAARSAARWLDALNLGDRHDTPIEELSHGNQQRAQLAVALVHDPELLVLDEPFSGLDPLGVDELGRMLSSLAEEGRTILFSSHQLDLVEDLCDDVVTINRGRVVLDGELSVLRARAQHRHLVLEAEGADLGWIEGLSGVEVVEQSDGYAEIVADQSIDLGAIVARVQEAGHIRRLDYRPPTLSQMFREAVTG